MQRVVGIVTSLILSATLAGCQEQKTVVVEQAQAGSMAGAVPPPQPRPVHITSPCAAPRGTGPFEPMPKPIHTQPVPKPPRALAEHVRGCGGVRFRIGPDGAPQDIEVMADYPVGYGFAETARQAIATSLWAPQDNPSWHYLIVTIIPPGS